MLSCCVYRLPPKKQTPLRREVTPYTLMFIPWTFIPSSFLFCSSTELTVTNRTSCKICNNNVAGVICSEIKQKCI